MRFVNNSDDPRLPVFYNFLHAVGKQCPNMGDDVKLFQYLSIAFSDKALALEHYLHQTERRFDGGRRVWSRNPPGFSSFSWMSIRGIREQSPPKTALTARGTKTSKVRFPARFTRWRFSTNLSRQLTPRSFVMLPQFVPLENPADVPPPSWDVVNSQSSSASGAGY